MHKTSTWSETTGLTKTRWTTTWFNSFKKLNGAKWFLETSKTKHTSLAGKDLIVKESLLTNQNQSKINMQGCLVFKNTTAVGILNSKIKCKNVLRFVWLIIIQLLGN